MEAAAKVSNLRFAPCYRIQAREVWAFLEITVVARQSEVCLGVFSSMLPRNNVFNVKRQRFSPLRQTAILTVTAGPFPHPLAQPRVHQLAFAWASTRRALA